MAEDESLTITAAEWNQKAGNVLLPALDSVDDLIDLKAQVEAGADLFMVTRGPELIGAYILRVDHLASGPEGVIVAAAGHIDGGGLLAGLLPVIEKQFMGVGRIRAHTNRPGIAKQLERAGYKAAEIVLRKTC